MSTKHLLDTYCSIQFKDTDDLTHSLWFSEEVQEQLLVECNNKCKNGGCLGMTGRCYRICYCYGVSKAIILCKTCCHMSIW